MAAPANRRTLVRGALALVAVAALALVATAVALAAFAARADHSGEIVTAVPDFTAPAITATAVGKSAGGATGFVKQGGSYYAYAAVAADTGNPPSGIASVKANVETLTTGQAAVAMEAGSFPAGGSTYNYRAGPLTANATLAEGAKSFAVTSADVAGNTKAANGAVTVDNTPPQAADIQTTNAGTNGLAEQNDTVVYTVSEPVEPESILGGWSGTATNVVVRIYDNGLLGLPLGDDELVVYNAANTAELPLGKVDLGRGDYVSGLLGGQITFGASGTASKMTMSGNTVTIVLGTYAAVGLVVGRSTAAGTGTMTWTPVATPIDRAGNVMSTAPATEAGPADRDF
ncbi:MAG: hypothetical protein JST31_09665 [Actinobacteria bacterium]|nr:hypothetical protein [Actinomycetota bacterium]